MPIYSIDNKANYGVSMRVIFIISLLAATTAFADDEVIVTSCEVTPSIWELKSPPELVKSNNLRRKTGSSEFAKGDFVTIEGRVVDSNCVPIEGVAVEIWQANSIGINQHDDGVFEKIDQNFESTGMTTTDNLGYYRFLSIMPGPSSGKRAPHVNFRLRHKDFMPIETEMFFENQVANGYDSNLNKQVDLPKRHLLLAKGEKINKNNTEEGIKYRFDITLEGKSKYKTY